MLEHTAACVHCGEQFTRTRLRGRPPVYCGRPCSRAASEEKAKADGRYAALLAAGRAKRAAERQARICTCTECGSNFNGTPKAKYCGDECRKAVRYRETRAWAERTDYHAKYRAKPEVAAKRREYERANGRAYRQGVKVPATCVVCGAEWMADCRAKSRPVKYCSRACSSIDLRGAPRTPVPARHPIRSTPVPDNHPARLSDCPRCTTTFTLQWPGQTYCTRRCADKAHHSRRDIRKRGQWVEDISPAAVYERDGWTCKLCSDPLDRDAVVPAWYAPTGDHVVPLAHGGAHSMANVQAAHFICNSRKGDRVEWVPSLAG